MTNMIAGEGTSSAVRGVTTTAPERERTGGEMTGTTGEKKRTDVVVESLKKLISDASFCMGEHSDMWWFTASKACAASVFSLGGVS